MVHPWWLQESLGPQTRTSRTGGQDTYLHRCPPPLSVCVCAYIYIYHPIHIHTFLYDYTYLHVSGPDHQRNFGASGGMRLQKPGFRASDPFLFFGFLKRIYNGFYKGLWVPEKDL